MRKYYLHLKSWIRKIFNNTNSGFIPYEVSKGYKLVFDENFKNLRKWRIGQPWGNIHTGSPRQYYGTDTVNLDPAGLRLNVKFNQKKIIVDGIEYNPEYSIGLVTTFDSWKYGYFHVTARLPRGKNLWPAIWLTGANIWPPEIDILEGYTKHGTRYESDVMGIRSFKLESNIHYGKTNDGTKDDIGSEDHVLPGDVTTRFVDFACWWEEDFIKIYYDGYLVRHITSKKILREMSMDSMILILNVVFDERKGGDPTMESPMIVKNVKIYQK